MVFSNNVLFCSIIYQIKLKEDLMKKFLLLTIFVFVFSVIMFAADKNILLKVPGIT